MSEIHQLYRLQQFDQEIASGKQRLLAVLKGQEEPDPLRVAKEVLAETAARHQKWRAQQKQEDLGLGSVISKLQSSEERLYSGNVKTPKELADLQLSVESLRRQRETMEEGLFATMMELEQAEGDLATAERIVSELTAEWQSQVAVLRQEQGRLAEHINATIGQRQEHAQHMAAAARTLIGAIVAAGVVRAAHRTAQGEHQGQKSVTRKSLRFHGHPSSKSLFDWVAKPRSNQPDEQRVNLAHGLSREIHLNFVHGWSVAPDDMSQGS